MRMIRRVLRWILAIVVGVLFVSCIAYGLGIFDQSAIKNFFENVKILPM